MCLCGTYGGFIDVSAHIICDENHFSAVKTRVIKPETSYCVATVEKEF